MHSSILILASSRKPGGICLAGKRFDGTQRGAWVRPVWDRMGHGWSAGALGARAGRIPAVGDVYEMPLAESQPWEHQPENWQVDAGAWGYLGHHPSQALIPFADDQATLWENGCSSFSGINDRVTSDMALSGGEGSLRLIRASRLRFIASVERERLKLRAQFVHGGVFYRLCVTDVLACEQWHARLSAGHNGAANALLCISLGKPVGGYCYKLVAVFAQISAVLQKLTEYQLTGGGHYLRFSR